MDIDILKEKIYYEIQLVNKDLYANFECCVGNSPSRIEILKYLYDNGKVMQADLQKEVNIDKAAITRHLQQLEASKTIVRSKEDGDQRVTWVELSASTRGEIEYLFQRRNQFVNDVLCDFSQEQLTMLYEMLSTIKNNISKTTNKEKNSENYVN